ncbi:MAG: ABC transporter substrate-binding protein [Polyangiaceae bacterium]|nr:ABC transporter substrate-binding protein [Polyangiaceae bacterium]
MRSIRKRNSDGLRRARIASVALSLVIGCSSELPAPIETAHPEEHTPQRGGIMTVASFGDIRAIDPANVGDGLVPQILEALFAGLIDYDHDGNIVADLAERWITGDDGKTFRFFLRHGVRFHDGEELSADDVKRSVERALHPSAPNPYASYFEPIVGYEDFVAGKANELEGVQAEGRYVVTFRLKNPDVTFLPTLAMPVLRPVCKSAGHRYTDTWQPCGAGPFKLEPKGWEHGRQVTVVRHDGYFKPGLPYLDGVRFLFRVNQTSQRFRFTSGELDILADFLAPDLVKFQADPRWKPFGAYHAEHQIAGEAMNTEMAPFDNVEVRRAVAAAIDREQIRLVRAANLRVADQPVPPDVAGHDDSLRGQRFDYEAALEHMKRAGYPYDPVTKTGGYPHVIPYVVYKQGLAEFTAQVLAQQLARIGLRIEIRVVNYPTFLAIRGRRGQSAFGPGSWTQDYPEAQSFLEPLFHSKSIAGEDSNNWSYYKNLRLDALLDQAKRELDDRKRKAIYKEAQQIIIDDAPWAFTYYYRGYTQWQPYVRNYRVHPMWTHEMSRVWLDRAERPGGAR